MDALRARLSERVRSAIDREEHVRDVKKELDARDAQVTSTRAQLKERSKYLEDMSKQMTEAEAKEAVAAVVKEVGAASPKEMGKVMAALKERYAGRMDFAKASALVKELLKPAD